MIKKIVIIVIVLIVVYGLIASCLTKAGTCVISERNKLLEQVLNNK